MLKITSQAYRTSYLVIIISNAYEKLITSNTRLRWNRFNIDQNQYSSLQEVISGNPSSHAKLTNSEIRLSWILFKITHLASMKSYLVIIPPLHMKS